MAAPFYIPTSTVGMTHFFYSFRFLCCCNQLILADSQSRSRKETTNKQKQVNNSKIWPGFLLHSLPEELPFSSPFLMGLLWEIFPSIASIQLWGLLTLRSNEREKKGWGGSINSPLSWILFPFWLPSSICLLLFILRVFQFLHIFSRVSSITIYKL